MKKNQKAIELNLAQMAITLAPQMKKYFMGGRGIGKSTIIGRQIMEIATSMPRAHCTIVGETFRQMLTDTLPSTIAGLELFGLYKDVHYFFGREIST